MKWDKLLSGRLILTLIAGVVFAYCSVVGKLPQDKIMEVVLVVIYAYFNRGDRGQTNGGTQK